MKKNSIIRKIEESEMPTSAMIDVVFLILIYFIITYKKVVAEAHISINLPSLSISTSKEIQEPPIKVTIKPDAYFLEQREMSLAQMESYILEQKRVLQDDVKINIYIHPDTLQQKIIDFINICKKHRVDKFNILEMKL